jgi:hypothetical protein
MELYVEIIKGKEANPLSKCRLLKVKSWMMILFLMGISPSCTLGKSTVLELKDVQSFKANVISAPTADNLKLSGLAFHSSLAVSDIEIIRQKESITVIVYLAPAKNGMSGNFEYIISLPNSINTVKFGTEGAVIWKREPA